MKSLAGLMLLSFLSCSLHAALGASVSASIPRMDERPIILVTFPTDESSINTDHPTLRCVWDRDMDTTKTNVKKILLPDDLSVTALNWRDARTLDIQYDGFLDDYGAKRVDLHDSYFASAEGNIALPAQGWAFNYDDPNSAPFMIGPIKASPQLLLANTDIEFTATAIDPNADPLTYTWDFGDGGSGSGTTATHSYAGTGPYLVTVTVTDGRGGVTSSSIVMAEDGGTAAGAPWTVVKGQISLGFSKPGRDRIKITGVIELPKDYEVGGKQMIVNVGGAGSVFKLDAKGKAKVGKNSFKLTRKLTKKVFLGGPVKIQFSMAGSYVNDLADEGFTSEKTSKAGDQKLIRILLGLDNQIFTSTPLFLYKNTSGKTGKALFKSAVR
jgi:hypothetical protein